MFFGRIAHGSAEDGRTRTNDLQAREDLGPEGLFVPTNDPAESIAREQE